MPKPPQFSIAVMTLAVSFLLVCLSHFFESRRHRQTKLELENAKQEIAEYRFQRGELVIDEGNVDRVNLISVKESGEDLELPVESPTSASARWLVHIPPNCAASVELRFMKQRELGLPDASELEHFFELKPGTNRISIGVIRQPDGTWTATGGRTDFEDSPYLPRHEVVMEQLQDLEWLPSAVADREVQIVGLVRQHSWKPNGPKLLFRIHAPDDGPELQFWLNFKSQ